MERKPFDASTGIDFNHPGVQGLLTATENGLTSFGELLSVSALRPEGRDNLTYLAAHGGAQRFAQGYQPGEASGDSGWGAMLESNRAFRPAFTYLRTLTPYISFDMARGLNGSSAPWRSSKGTLPPDHHSDCCVARPAANCTSSAAGCHP